MTISFNFLFKFSNPASVQEDIPIAIAHPNPSSIPVQHGFSTSSQQTFQSMNHQDIIQYVLNHPVMLKELLGQLGALQITSPTVQMPQEQYYRNQQQAWFPHQAQQLSTPSQIQSTYQPAVTSPMQYQQQLYNQQLFSQSTSLPVASSQSNNGNQYQPFQINNGQPSTQQIELDAVTSSSYEDIFDDVLPEYTPCNRTDQVK